jgi:hypothetical protein
MLWAVPGTTMQVVLRQHTIACRNVDLSHPPVHNSDECGNQVTLHGHCPRSQDDMKVARELK